MLRLRRLIPLPALLLTFAAATATAQMMPSPAERTEFQAGPTMYDDLMQYVMELEASSELMNVQKLTETLMGRDLVVCILANPPVHRPADVLNSGKPIVLIVNNVHGGEVAGKDASLILMRDLLHGDERSLLDDVVVLVVPTINPDGAEARRRTNEQGFDMNRDYLKLESQEVHAVVTKLINPWQPDIHIDTHHGGSAPYALVYQTCMNPSGDPNLIRLGNEVILPRVRAALRAEDYDGYWYTGPRRTDEGWQWNPTTVEARKQHVYSTLANMAGFLFETPSNSHRVVDNGTRVVEIPREERYRHQVRGQYIGLREMIRFAAAEPELLRSTVNAAKQSAIERGNTVGDDDEIVLDYEQQSKFKDDFWVRGEDAETNGGYELVNGDVMTLWTPTRTTPRPWGYIMPPQLATLVPALLDHNITVKRLSEPVTLEVETYFATSIVNDQYYQGHQLKTIVADKQTEERTFPAGSFFIPSGQPKSNLISYLLEPETNDSLARWNYLDSYLRVTGDGGGRGGRRGAAPPPVVTAMTPDQLRARVQLQGLLSEVEPESRQQTQQRGGRGQGRAGRGQRRGGRGGRGGFGGGRGGGQGRGQLIAIHRVMQKTPMKGLMVEHFNGYEKNRYIRYR